MRLVTALACFVSLVDGFAQSIVTLDAIRYPPVAAAAHVRGDVLISDGNVVSGPEGGRLRSIFPEAFKNSCR
jgi:hypothetical protein